MVKIVTHQKQYKFVGVIMLFLAIIIGVFAILNLQGEKPIEGLLQIKVEKSVIATLDIDAVKQLPVVKKKVVINSTQGLSKHEFTCTPLAAVFNEIDPEIVSQYQKVITKGVDNYTSVVEMAEVLEEDNVYLVYGDQGNPLKMKSGKEGAMQIIVLYDEFGQRFTNFLVELQLE